MNTKFILFSIAIAILTLTANAQTGCPGCVVSLPTGMPADTIYFGVLLDGTVGEPYDQSVSFRVPKTTTPINAIDPSVPGGFTIQNYTLNSVSNIPPGLDYTLSATSIDPDVNTDGCIRFCGTPLVAGEYNMVMSVDVDLGIISQNYDLNIVLVILPGSSSNFLFTTNNPIGCGTVTSSFTNNFPSNGVAGYSYNWDFGVSSSDAENPADVTFDAPGVYPVSMTVIIDTVGPLLNTVLLSTATCGDVNLPPLSVPEPDVFIEVYDPSGALLYTSSTQQNTNLPYTFNLPAIPLGAGSYSVQIWDEDLPPLDADDLCGEFTFTLAESGVTLENNGASIIPEVIVPTTTLTASDTVEVFALPATPELTAPEPSVCGGFTTINLSPATGDVQWYVNNAPVQENDYTYVTSESGVFTASVMDANGCTSEISSPIEITILAVPAAPEWTNNGSNLLQLNANVVLPANYTLQWYLEDQAIPNANEQDLCITSSGNYTLLITNTDTDCQNEYADVALFNPTLPCTNDALDVLYAQHWKIFPNPAIQQTVIDWTSQFADSKGQIALFDIMGRQVMMVQKAPISHQMLDVSALPTGVYTVRLQADAFVQTIRLVVE